MVVPVHSLPVSIKCGNSFPSTTQLMEKLTTRIEFKVERGKPSLVIQLITRINHSGFTVADVEKSAEFYRDLLGMKLVSLSERPPEDRLS